jgi:hypothetical protein
VVQRYGRLWTWVIIPKAQTKNIEQQIWLEALQPHFVCKLQRALGTVPTFWQCFSSGSVGSVFLEPPDPDPLVFLRIWILPSISKKERKNFISTLFCHFILTFYLRRLMSMFQKVISRKTYCLLASCQPLTKKAGTWSVSQWYRSADTDPYQNVTNPQHCFFDCSLVKVPVPVPSIPFTVNQYRYTLEGSE